MAEKNGFNNNKFTSSKTFLVSGIVAQWSRSCLHVQMSIPDLGSASDWLKQISQAARIIRNTTQIWVVWDGPLENLSGGGRSTKKIFAQGKIK